MNNQFLLNDKKSKYTLQGMVLLGALCCTPYSQAKDTIHQADKPTDNPPDVIVDRNKMTNEVRINLEVRETQGNIFNPGTNKYDEVSLRSYQDADNKGNNKKPFVGPTIRIKPGDTVRVNIDNQLPPEDSSCSRDINTPHNFNSTNLHSHGLWISPAGNSDNVLIKIDPGVKFTYEWNIPADHPAGTFWYHPHLHGSTALQVSSGMAGALIIEGNRTPTVKQNGDIDTLLKHSDGTSFTERLAVFGQIQYACRGAYGQIKIAPDGDIKRKGEIVGPWFCDEHDTGTITNYDQFGPWQWGASGRYTTINGEVLPHFSSTAGTIERWRLVHAGVTETLKPTFYKVSGDVTKIPTASKFAEASTLEKNAFIKTHCSGKQVTQLSLAMDGLTRDRLVEQTHTILQPGYREDLLMTFPEEGTYCIIDEDTPSGNINGTLGTKKILGFVDVKKGESTVDNVVQHIKDKLIESAKTFMPEPIKKTIVDDLTNNLHLTKFVDHPTVLDKEVTGHQTLAFNISFGDNIETTFDVGELNETGGAINLHPYKANRVDRHLVLGDVEEWTLKSFSNKQSTANDGHPFHIHVNPFQIISIKDKHGNEVSGYEAGNTSPYANLQGVWKDTLFIDADDYTITTRTRYQRYIGEFVLHCHILDHEDQGMMQNVKISLPGADGKPTSAHSGSH